MEREIKFRALIENRKSGEKRWEYYTTLSQPVWMEGVFDKIIVKDLQFTGLLDKNKKEIYEGDVIKSAESGRCYPIEFHGGAFTARLKMLYLPTHSWRDLEIIGNIYENPELLTSNTTIL